MGAGEKLDNVVGLALAAYADCLERIDTLLQEARHVQQNIIYTLRAPVLYRVLRFEENAIWGDWADDLFDEFLDGKKDASTVARRSTIRFPRPQKLNPSEDTILSSNSNVPEYKIEADKIRLSVTRFIERQWVRGYWTPEQQRYYHNLCSIQRLKRNLVKDRLILNKEAALVFKPKARELSPTFIECLSRFMVLRGAVNARIWEYIDRFGDCQGQFAKSQDIRVSQHDHSKPSMERRREQRIYSAHLSDRCRDFWSELALFWTEGLGCRLVNNEGMRKPFLEHRWQHHFTSQFNHFRDTAGSGRGRDKSGKNRVSKDIYFINTSFFMPDRPDLQGLISHEVAHGFLYDAIGGASPQTFSYGGNPFCSLLRTIYQYLKNRDIDKVIPDAPLNLEREIAVDLLVASIQGPAYLYAVFLELCGSELDSLFRTGADDYVDLELLDRLSGASGQYDLNRGWFIRLSILCVWIEEMAYSRSGNAFKDEAYEKISSSVRFIINNMISYLDTLAPLDMQSKGYWLSLQSDIRKIVCSSEMIFKVRGWIKTKSKDCYCKNARAKNNPSYSQPLNQVPREFLIVWLQDRIKQLKGKDLSQDEKGKLEKKYAVSQKGLYEYIYDIPWQTSTLFISDGLNYLGDSDFDSRNVVKDISKMISLMREGYMFALEFYLATTEPSSVRIEDVSKLLIDECLWYEIAEKSSSVAFIECFKQIWRWFGGRKDSSFYPNRHNFAAISYSGRKFIEKKDLCDIADEHIDYVSRLLEICVDQGVEVKDSHEYKEIRKIGAVQLIKVNTKVSGERTKKFLYNLMDEKLRDLCLIIKKCGNDTDGQFLKQFELFSSLYDYLQIVTSNYPEVDSEGTATNYITWFKVVANSLCKDSTSKVLNQSYTLGRITLGGMHRLIDSDEMFECYQTCRGRLESSRLGLAMNNLYYYNSVSLAGHYDCIISAPQIKNSIFHLPQFCFPSPGNSGVIERTNEHKELFIPFFVRWEVGLPMRLDSASWEENRSKEESGQFFSSKVICFVSIALTKSSSRFSFLARLLKSISCKQSSGADYVGGLGGYIEKRDRAFLSDGSEDVLLVLTGNAEDVERAFKLKRQFEDDFQVASAEILFTTYAMDSVLLDGTKINTSMKIRSLNAGNLKLGKISERIANNFSQKQIPLRLHMYRLPRKMDYGLRFEVDKNEKQQITADIGNVHATIIKSFKGSHIDRMQSELYYVEEDKLDDFSQK